MKRELDEIDLWAERTFTCARNSRRRLEEEDKKQSARERFDALFQKEVKPRG